MGWEGRLGSRVDFCSLLPALGERWGTFEKQFAAALGLNRHSSILSHGAQNSNKVALFILHYLYYEDSYSFSSYRDTVYQISPSFDI